MELRWNAALLGAELDALRNELQVDSSSGDVPFVVHFGPL